ncbi:hypothetical protein [Sediminibacillus massiliensis]|uniref:hypothetical protein n=1 Tax=Sediminibacillus massiliensis TaxID=1926277 RepID=UPI00098872BE|nr:hypothetical protein [Sediminibacillus massiliensis]
MTKQRDDLEDKLKKLPRYEMDAQRKSRNYHELKKPKESNGKFFVYPLTVCTFLLMIFAGYVLFFESRETATTPVSNKEKEYSEIQKFFNGVKPIYSDSHIPDSAGIPEQYQKSVALGYLYNASIFYTPEGEKVNPLDINHAHLGSYFDYEEENIDTSYGQSKVLEDTKPTWVYLNSANVYIDNESVTKDLNGLTNMITQIHAANPFHHNYSAYQKVSRKISEMAIDVNQVAGKAIVYEGTSENWFVRLQPLDDEDFILYLDKKRYDGKKENSATAFSLSVTGSGFSLASELSGKSRYIYGEDLPENVTEWEEINIEIELAGIKEVLTLKKR